MSIRYFTSDKTTEDEIMIQNELPDFIEKYISRKYVSELQQRNNKKMRHELKRHLYRYFNMKTFSVIIKELNIVEVL